ncbi:signal peptidase I [Paenibacillus gansuensis]|uniref:Signal peptidase I n=1 Tax=Paenibacillus gansuensis TaxID=306542 RepID=A0ABW5PJN9_9BACL
MDVKASEAGSAGNQDQDGEETGLTLKEAADWAKSIAAALVVVIFLHLFVFNLSTVLGHSMEPTLKEKEWLFVNKMVYLWDGPDRGDVVILTDPAPTDPDKKYLVKRVIGVPGDRVEITKHRVLVNGKPLAEGYTDTKVEGDDVEAVVVPEGAYYVMGDNRHLYSSKDSRFFGPVPQKLIKGRADFILWPFGKMGSL